MGLAAATAVCGAVFAYNATVLSASTPATPSAGAEQRVGLVTEQIGPSVALTGPAVAFNVRGDLTDNVPDADAVTTRLGRPGRLPGPYGAIEP